MEILSKIYRTRRNHSPKKNWQMEIGTQVNVIPLNTNLSCYNTVDKATSSMSKNTEPGIINYVPLY